MGTGQVLPLCYKITVKENTFIKEEAKHNSILWILFFLFFSFKFIPLFLWVNIPVFLSMRCEWNCWILGCGKCHFFLMLFFLCLSCYCKMLILKKKNQCIKWINKPAIQFMNQGRGIYLDLCSHSIGSFVGLINLQFQVRTEMATCWRNECLLDQARSWLLYLHYAVWYSGASNKE